MIEARSEGPTRYRCFVSDFPDWTTDVNAGLQFSRRVDADSFSGGDPEDVCIAEHVFVDDELKDDRMIETIRAALWSDRTIIMGICHAYESGFGDGVNGKPNENNRPKDSTEHIAYDIGHESGAARRAGMADSPTTALPKRLAKLILMQWRRDGHNDDWLIDALAELVSIPPEHATLATCKHGNGPTCEECKS